jgi:MFS family permease
MLLFLQHLKATATILALAACLSPVLNILQIPSARFVEKVGYRRFVLSGWTSRSFFVVGMTVVAFLPDSMDASTRIFLMLALSFGYNTLRGISSCGMLPWFTHIVPETRARWRRSCAFSFPPRCCACPARRTPSASSSRSARRARSAA